MKTRLAIFSFFDKEGYVDSYVSYLLAELKPLVSRLIVVVNGQMQESGLKTFRKFTDEICIRDNVGFDAGAYKEILVHYLSESELCRYDEVILCNDTFFGPLVPMRDIFEKMEERDCDMWGMDGYLEITFPYIQSYFLVFRKKIIQKNLLRDYFSRYVEEKTESLYKVYCQFEVGLYDYLSRIHSMKSAVFSNGTMMNPYQYSYTLVSKYNLVAVKKKAFADWEKHKNNILCTLSYIKYYTHYDVNMILECIKRVYNWEIGEICELEYYEPPTERMLPMAIYTETEIANLLGDDEFYIYGTGFYGHRVYWRFARENPKFKGFIVSDGQEIECDELFGYPIYHFSKVEDFYSYKIVLGLDKENTERVVRQFEDLTNIIRIF